MAIFGDFLHPAFPLSRVQHLSDLHPKFALRHIMCGSTVDIQSGTAAIRRGKKDRRKKIEEETIGQKYNGRVTKCMKTALVPLLLFCI